MNAPNLTLFALLAMADLSVLAFLRLRHFRTVRARRMMRSLRIAMRQDLAGQQQLRAA